METLIAIFGLGVGVTLVVAKGLLNAHEFAKADSERKAEEEGPVDRQG
jgi:hypothetical protein